MPAEVSEARLYLLTAADTSRLALSVSIAGTPEDTGELVTDAVEFRGAERDAGLAFSLPRLG